MATKKYLDLDGLERFKQNSDAKYISQETDPTVPSWAKQSTKPSYDANEINYTFDADDTYLDYNFSSDTNIEDATNHLIDELNTKAYDITEKQDILVSGSSIKTINNQSILGSGNISISSGSEIIIETITSTISVSANTTAQTTVNTSKTGYVFLGVVGLGASDNAIGFIQWRIFSTSTILVCRNFTSSAKNNITITIKALYMKE